MSAHTPGPWRALRNCLGAAITIYDERDRPIATTASNGSVETMAMHRSGEVAANAQLLAAAPELLAALQSALTILVDSVGDFDIAKAEAAIAKATGSTS